jgi:hypothetical protein
LGCRGEGCTPNAESTNQKMTRVPAVKFSTE